MTHDFTAAEAITISREGSFDLDMPPDKALPLFTAPGERLWISHWDPVILNGNGVEKGTVFITSGHGHTTYWYVTQYDTKTRQAHYVRVTPGADTGSVNVTITPNSTGGATVHVAYQLTSLSAAGTQNLKTSFSEERYGQMMQEWQSMIEANRARIDAHFSL